MITKCPSCSTVFRVTPDQLQAHQGQVRCGRCATVFDGLLGLVASLEPVLGPAARPGAVETAAFELQPVEPPKAAEPQPVVARSSVYVEEDFGPAPEQLSLYPEEPRRGARWWAAGAALLALALAGQAAYSYRADLSAQYPGLRPYFLQLCDRLHCQVLPPQRPKQIAIEASDLQATDPARPGVIRLTATLRNHAGHTLGYPALDLVLTNTKEHTLARRIFLPQEYLDHGKDVAAGIPANAELTVRLDLDTGDLNPAGFRLDLLPAPPP
jgi:predicted Zn finger-like uncharacterized protein